MKRAINRYTIAVVDQEWNNWRNVIHACPHKNSNLNDFSCTSLFLNINKLIIVMK